MGRHLASNVLTLLVVALIAIGGLIAWGQKQFTGPGPLEQAIFFEVERGATLNRVSRDLAERGAVSSAPIFRIGADYTDKAGDLKFGTYELRAGAPMAEILDILTKGGQSSYRYVANYIIGVGSVEMRLSERTPGTGEVQEVAAFAPDGDVPDVYAELVESGRPIAYRVTVAPGTTVWQVAQGLGAAGFLAGETGPLPDEGMIAPDTYEVRSGSDRAALLADMVAAQSAIMAAAWEERAADLPLASPEEAMVLASIVEKETGIVSERRQVASVFVNRLRQGMRLQTDPTVIYGMTEGKAALGRGLRQSELRRDTPYNTYVIEGLPPTAIANPSRDAIEAAVDPAETDLLFFVADGSGGHVFAETLAEHNRNVARWRAIEAEHAE
ncbi:endolytic transglycosylase MltG [Maritimibacter sp. 55A14]|uniref:endolytic transglycosylase MltG n=1 Tax=Maritimibacter sp. 55A14 TaxID=2174844 RepID=UPI000D617BAF|nr:endolytic transglycosylase MltG [Maritimibacter sp. 55A14]PWE30642.1 endolytic transglycosylase MltG [Maritimibacter sp. 55A14]